MEEKKSPPQWHEDLTKEGQSALEAAQMSDADRRKKLFRWGFRQVLTLMLVWFLRDKSWINILVWVWIPLAILSLLSILFYNRVLAWRMNRFQKNMEDTLARHHENQKQENEAEN